MITPGEYTFTRVVQVDPPVDPPTPPGQQQLFAYATDSTIWFTRQFEVSPGLGIFNFQFRIRPEVATAGSPALFSLDWMLDRSVAGLSQMYTSTNGGPYEPYAGAGYGLGDNQFSIGSGFGPAHLLNYEEREVAVPFVVEERFFMSTDPLPTYSIAHTFDYRMLILEGFKAQPNRFNPEKTNAQFVGEWLALPASTLRFPTGWKPDSDISYDLQLQDPQGNLLRSLPGTSLLIPGAPDPQGKVADFSQSWDSKDGSGQVLEGTYLAANGGAAAVPTFGGTVTRGKEDWIQSSRCNCLDGQCRLSMSWELQKSPVGPPLKAVMSYNGQNYLNAAASPGFGWSGNDSVRVTEEPNGDLIYQDEMGQALRWTLQAGVYVPFLPDNYSDAEKVVGNPNFVYAITFPDQNRREFDALGRLLRELDRNNNAATYTRDGNGSLTQMTDATGRVLEFTTTRSDGQPEMISSNGREIRFFYYPDTDPVSPNRLQSVQDPAGDTQSFTYTLAGLIEQIIDTRGNVAVQYAYDGLGRKLVEQHYDQMALYFDYLDAVGAMGVGVTQVDLSADPDPERASLTYFDNRFNAVERYQLVDPVGPVINLTLMAYTDPLNPYLMTKQIDPNLAQTSRTYNSLGNLQTYTNAQGRTYLYQYAEDIEVPLNPKHRNLLMRIHRPTVTVGGVPTTYPPTLMNYDLNGNLVQVVDALLSTTGISVLPNGQVDSITDRRGFTTAMGYYPDRNLQSITTPGGPGPAPARMTTLGYDAFDNLNLLRDR
ncbi:RHS repeat protein [bacterium]|nr:RHS repeat protein [bacterium]